MYVRRWIITDIWYLAKVFRFYPEDLSWGSDSMRSMFEKDYCIIRVKDISHRDLKQEKHLRDRRDAKSSTDSVH